MIFLENVQKLNKLEKDLLREISSDNLMDYTAQVSSEIRLSGSQEELKAFHYVKGKLESWGIQTELTFEKTLISLPKCAHLEIDGQEYSCITHSMATSTEQMQAEMIYVDNDVTEEVDLEGKIVLANGLASPGHIMNFSGLGAIGAVFINKGDFTHEMIVSPVWGSPNINTVDLLPDIPVVSVVESIGEKIKAQLIEGKNAAKLYTEVEREYKEIPTLIGEIKGNVDPEKYVLFSGHIDSWHYGAMDNGTANAVMMEVARIISSNREQLKRSIKFAFWSGHSHGRYAGSAAYCDENWLDLHSNCYIHVNIDSVGGKGAEIIQRSSSMAETKGIANEVLQELLQIEFIGKRIGRDGDQSFYGVGIPSLFTSPSRHGEKNDFETPSKEGAGPIGLGWWWHTTEDKMDKIDPDVLQRDCGVYLLIIYRLLHGDLIPIDQLAAIEEIEAELRRWQKKAKHVFDLTNTIEYCDRLKNNFITFENNLNAVNITEQNIKIFNRLMIDLSNLLVPLNYVKESIYSHDLALSQEPIPKLEELSSLLKMDEGSSKFYVLLRTLIQRKNEINHMLSKANHLVNKAQSKLH